MKVKENFDSKFKKLVMEDKLNINSLEDLMTGDIENYKKELIAHVEDLLSNELNEDKLIIKKKMSGILEDLSLKIKEKKR